MALNYLCYRKNLESWLWFLFAGFLNDIAVSALYQIKLIKLIKVDLKSEVDKIPEQNQRHKQRA
ncbi:hypothetical protein DRW42_02870 [Pedobacter miscanthi]|uniref:Uncharacterized protein n=1 Tax=Pedobacter miscanthi TaxID=2259170 RepID=A0A366LC12_9SPHI|nr:hypothetical protein DRW42_02870 [Pedobacter miscanthi]